MNDDNEQHLKMEIIFSGSGGAYGYYMGICEVLQTNFDLSEVLFSSVSGGCYSPVFLLSQKNIPFFLNKHKLFFFINYQKHILEHSLIGIKL